MRLWSATARGLLSVGGSITEIIYELGADQRIVAIDSTSQYPERALKEKSNVGYMRALSPEGVLGVAPSLILALQGSGPPQTLSVLESAGVPMVMVGDEYSGEGIIRKIDLVAKAMRLEDRGQCLAGRVRRDLDMLAQWRAGIGRPIRVVFVMSFVNGRAMVAGRKTAADGIIRMAGAVNAIDQFEGYKQLEDESVVAAQPDAVLVDGARWRRAADRERGLRPSRFCSVAGRVPRSIRGNGRALSPRVRAAYRGGGA